MSWRDELRSAAAPSGCMQPYHAGYGIYVDCYRCFWCLENKVALPKFDPSEEQRHRARRKRAMLSMSLLPDHDPGFLGGPGSPGVPGIYRRAILDFNAQRTRAFSFHGKGRSAAMSAAIRRYSKTRAALGEPRTDPLLWLLRVWWNVWTPALSPDPLQPGSDGVTDRGLSAWSAPSSTFIRCMAAWAHRCLPGEPLIPQICLQVCLETGSVLYEHSRYDRDGNRVRGTWETRDTGTQYQFPSEAAATWLSWLGLAHDQDIPIPRQAVGTRTFHRARWEEMGLTSDHAKAVATSVPETWFDAFRYHRC